MSILTVSKKFFFCMVLLCGTFIESNLGHAAQVSCIDPTPTPTGSLTPGYTGLLFDTVYCGNDPDPFGKSYINGSPSLVKINIADVEPNVPLPGVDGAGPGDQSDDVVLSSLVYNGSDIISGSWTFTHDAGELYPTIALIKAGNTFFLQSIVAWALTGTFSTSLLDGKGLSHISFYDGAGPRELPPQVPLPAALPMFLVALGGLAWISRRRKLKLS